jgi:hypothetical protein
LIEEADKLLFQILCYERGERCEICGKPSAKLGLFHILPKGAYPKIRFRKVNILLAGWFCCHLPWHHNYYEARDRIEPRIKELRGVDYENKLRAMDLCAKTLSTERIRLTVMSFRRDLDRLERGWQNNGSQD